MSSLEEENRILKKKLQELEDKQKKITFKVGQKGGVSVYGLGRFPVTLYAEQWKKLLDQKDYLLRFIEEHEDELKV